MSPRRFRRAARAGTVIAVGVLVAVFGASLPSSAATPGVWGVQQAPYLDGTICTSGNETSPLASWNFGDTAPEFLLTGVSSNGITDSATLPEAGVPGRTVSSVFAGQFGFGSSASIATYAALISDFGSGPDPDAENVAEAVLALSDPGSLPSCGDPTAADALVSKAQQLAGPYTLSVSAATTPAVPGEANSAQVRVTNGSGQPVPGAHVTVSAALSVFNGQGSANGTTDATGVATIPFTVPTGGALSSLELTATASVATTLEAVTVQGGLGSYADAVFADPPTSYQGSVSVPISLSASPVLHSTLSATALGKGTALALSATLTGMAGHAGTASFAVLGPLALNASTLCAGYNSSSFSHAATAASSQVQVQGDSTLTGGNWTPSQAGCYLLSETITTTDATPQATAHAAPQVLTVLDTTAAAAPLHIVQGPGAFSEPITVTHSYSRPGTVALTIAGPLTPGDGDCSTADWSKAKSITSPMTKTSGDGTVTAATPALTKPGCYQVHATLRLALSSSVIAPIPVTSTTASGIIYVLAPTVTASALATSVSSPNTVRATVAVQDTFGQPGHLSIEMYETPSNTFGCRTVTFAHAKLISTGAAVATNGDGQVTVTSGRTPTLGCYALVPKLVMDGNSAVVATGKTSLSNVVLVGLGIAPPAARAKVHVNNSLLTTFLTFSIFLVLLLALCFGVFRYVLTHRGLGEDGDGGPSPFGSPFAALLAAAQSRR